MQRRTPRNAEEDSPEMPLKNAEDGSPKCRGHFQKRLPEMQRALSEMPLKNAEGTFRNASQKCRGRFPEMQRMVPRNAEDYTESTDFKQFVSNGDHLQKCRGRFPKMQRTPPRNAEGIFKKDSEKCRGCFQKCFPEMQRAFSKMLLKNAEDPSAKCRGGLPGNAPQKCRGYLPEMQRVNRPGHQ